MPSDKKGSGNSYTPSHIANYFIWLSRHQNVRDLTPIKLIKLVYIGYAWYYYLKDKPLFDEAIEAWEHGPVIPSLYAEFKEFGKNPITKYATHTDFDSDGELGEVTYPMIEENDKEVSSIMGTVFNFYKEKTGAQLSDITHREDGVWEYVHSRNTDPSENIKIKMTDPEILKKIKEEARKGIEKLLQHETAGKKTA